MSTVPFIGYMKCPVTIIGNRLKVRDGMGAHIVLTTDSLGLYVRGHNHDVNNVQWACDNVHPGGTVQLAAGTFQFGDDMGGFFVASPGVNPNPLGRGNNSVYISKSLTLQGKMSTNGKDHLTQINGGIHAGWDGDIIGDPFTFGPFIPGYTPVTIGSNAPAHWDGVSMGVSWEPRYAFNPAVGARWCRAYPEIDVHILDLHTKEAIIAGAVSNIRIEGNKITDTPWVIGDNWLGFGTSAAGGIVNVPFMLAPFYNVHLLLQGQDLELTHPPPGVAMIKDNQIKDIALGPPPNSNDIQTWGIVTGYHESDIYIIENTVDTVGGGDSPLQISGTYPLGIYISQSGLSPLINRNTIKNVASAILVMGYGHSPVITHNIIENARARGIVLWSTENSVAAKNDIHMVYTGPLPPHPYYHRKSGINMEGVQNASITNNKITGQSDYAIQVTPLWPGNVLATNNVFRGNNLNGFTANEADIWLLEGAKNNTFVGHNGTVIDQGAGNKLTGLTPRMGNRPSSDLT